MDIIFRPAKRADLPILVKMLVEDSLGATREDYSEPLNPAYIAAFIEIENDKNNLLAVAEFAGNVVGLLQITFIPYLTYTGSWRCLIEGVRVHQDYQGRGFGRRMFEWAIEQAKLRNCRLVQLTSNKSRQGALKFYESMGFIASHEGFKLDLQ